jgi:hypothetical protein
MFAPPREKRKGRFGRLATVTEPRCRQRPLSMGEYEQYDRHGSADRADDTPSRPPPRGIDFREAALRAHLAYLVATNTRGPAPDLAHCSRN